MSPAVLWLLACGAPAPPAPPAHDAYVWRRDWTEEVVTSVASSAAAFDGLRIAALATDRTGTWALSNDILPALAGRAVVPVAKIEPGQRIDTALGLVLGATVTRWRAAGVRVSAVEIDHPCPTARLGEYARSLREVRDNLPRDVALWTTASAAWLDDPAALGRLRAMVDGTVLRLEAVDDRVGASIAKYAAGRRPFRLALPPSPAALDLAARLDRDRPPGWLGIAWLPDERGPGTLPALAARIRAPLPHPDDGVAEGAGGPGLDD